MKSLVEIINEKLKISKEEQKEKIIAKDIKDLQSIILNEIRIQGVNISLKHIDVSAITDMSYLFSAKDFKNVESIDISGWNVSNVKNVEGLFEELDELKEIIGFGDLQFKNVERFDSCFASCHKLEYIENIENLKIYPSCKSLSFMFSCCNKLEELNLNNWNVSNIEWFSGMFMSNYAKYIHVDKWDVSNGFSFSNMFYNCKNLVSLNLSGWNISKGKIFDKMFAFCENLQSIGKIDKWNLSLCKDYTYLFYNCKKLELDVTNWIFNDNAKKLSMFTKTNRNKFIRPNIK